MPKLSKRVIDSAEPQAKDYFLWDETLPGFGLRVMPSGFKGFVVQYRAGGRTRRLGLGRVGTLTAEQAKVQARDVLARVAQGENPAEELRLYRRSPTVIELGERFLAVHVAKRCKPSTQAEYRRSVELFIKPALGSFKVADVTRADIAELHNAHSAIPYQANRTLGVLSKMFNLAEVWGLRADGSNPCRHVPKYAESKRERFLSAEERQRLGDVLEEFDQSGEVWMKPAIACIRLLLLTGCRLGEIQTLKWDYVRNGAIFLPDSKTGARRIVLTPAAREVLDAIPRVEGNPNVIVGKKPGAPLADMQNPWQRIRAKAGLADVRLHDLRHSFASDAAGLGFSLPMIGKLLGHSTPQSTARYAHLADDPLTAAAEKVALAIVERSKRKPEAEAAAPIGAAVKAASPNKNSPEPLAPNRAKSKRAAAKSARPRAIRKKATLP